MRTKSNAPWAPVAWFLAIIMITGALILGSDVVLGSDSAPTRSGTLHVGPGYTYTSITSAISAASTGDHIVIHAGIYNESITLDKRLELHGTDMNTTIINGNGATALKVTVDGCRVSGLNLTGGIPVGWSGEEVWTAGLVLNSDLNEVYGCYMHDNYFGLLLKNSDNNWIHDSISSENMQHGVYFTGSKGNRLDSFHSYSNRVNGFGFFISPDNDFYHCRSERNGRNGWEIWDSEREYIRFSTANDNANIGFMVGGSFDMNWFENCQAVDNTKDGFWLHVEAYQVIENCTIAMNGRNGIYLPYNGYASRAIVFNNLIMNNTNWAVKIEADCDDSQFYRNDLINNRRGQTPQVTDDGGMNLWNKGNTGNYWHEWTSPDVNSDGIVDDPYINNGGTTSKDNYPSTHRFTNHSYEVPGGSGSFTPCLIKSYPGDAVVGELYTVYFDVVDKDTPDIDLTWGVDTQASWLSMERNVLKGQPTLSDVGIHTVRIWVTDGVGTDEFIFDIKVVEDTSSARDNEYPPKIIKDHIHNAMVGLYYTNSYRAEDPDTDLEKLEWEVTTTATFLFMDGNSLEGMPGVNDIGAFTVSIRVADGEFIDISSFTLMVHPSDAVIDDDEGSSIELLDIIQGPRMETGETILTAKDLTEGRVNFIEFQWYIDGALIGNQANLIILLEEGTHNILLRARALDDEWFEVNKEVKIERVPDNSKEIDILAISVVIVLMVTIILIALFFIYTRRKRYSSRKEHLYQGIHDPDHGHGHSITDNPDIKYSEVESGAVRWGSIDNGTVKIHKLEREGAALRGPNRQGPRSSLEKEYRQISDEALSWKRPSRFSMNGEKMNYKLKMKLDMGDIDPALHNELKNFIEDHFQDRNN